MVVNGATKTGDIAHFKAQLAEFDGDVSMEHLEDRPLIALQGIYFSVFMSFSS